MNERLAKAKADNAAKLAKKKIDVPLQDPATSTVPVAATKPQLVLSKQEVDWLASLLHIAATDRQVGGLSPIRGQGSPSVNDVVAMFANRLGQVAEGLPDRAQ